MYAIIAAGGKQYRVEAGDKVRVEKIEAEVGSQVTFDRVLMVSADTALIGNPYVDDAVVEGEVIRQGKAKKVIVYKYKPKTGYHKKNGHRQLFTEVLITKIIAGGVEYIAEEPVDEEEPEAAGEAAAAEEVIVETAEETAEETAQEVTGEEAAEETPAQEPEEKTEE